MLVYAATIFLSAFLLFQVQPLIAKFILPWFGGSAAVWSAALLFFQLLLLAGYFYAHLLIRYLKPKQQMWVHGALLALSLATLPIIPHPLKASLSGQGTGDPTGRILFVLAMSVGLPYTLLSSTSPLLQAWYVRAHASAVPYRLFALSNFGSMIALISYPAVIEPAMGLHPQAVMWSSMYLLFTAVCGMAAWRSRMGAESVRPVASKEVTAPGLSQMFSWIGLAACASILLLAVTSHLTQNIAPIPLLWVAPLSLYLLSFILCFESDRLYSRVVFLPLLALALAALTYSVSNFAPNLHIKKLIPVLCGALFICCMVCHGELARQRPHPRYLTQFYLMVSIGGALGGIFVALISPRIFNDYLELPIAMVVLAALEVRILWKQARTAPHPPWFKKAFQIAFGLAAGSAIPLGFILLAARIPSWTQAVYSGLEPVHEYLNWAVPLCIMVGLVFLVLRLGPAWIRGSLALCVGGFAIYLGYMELQKDKAYVRSVRNFYGVMHVRDDPADEYGVPAQRVLVHGTIDHGTQLLSDKAGRVVTSYFGRTSGIYRAIQALHDQRGPLRLGILGLGAGVTATLANQGDTLHYYEINPLVLDVALSQFGFLKGCPAKPQVFMGDARLVLEDLPSENLDFLAMDAFTSDAVPMHLLTKEAYRIYLRHLKPNGILAIHISNRYLNLQPVVSQAMHEIGWYGRVIEDDGSDEPYYTGTTWTILSPSDDIFKTKFFASNATSFVNPLEPKPGFRGWTDDFSNIITILK